MTFPKPGFRRRTARPPVAWGLAGIVVTVPDDSPRFPSGVNSSELRHEYLRVLIDCFDFFFFFLLSAFPPGRATLVYSIRFFLPWPKGRLLPSSFSLGLFFESVGLLVFARRGLWGVERWDLGLAFFRPFQGLRARKPVRLFSTFTTFPAASTFPYLMNFSAHVPCRLFRDFFFRRGSRAHDGPRASLHGTASTFFFFLATQLFFHMRPANVQFFFSRYTQAN